MSALLSILDLANTRASSLRKGLAMCNPRSTWELENPNQLLARYSSKQGIRSDNRIVLFSSALHSRVLDCTCVHIFQKRSLVCMWVHGNLRALLEFRVTSTHVLTMFDLHKKFRSLARERGFSFTKDSKIDLSVITVFNSNKNLI